jgi:MFS family permease
MNKQDREAWIIAISLFVSLFFLWGGGYNTMPVFLGALLKAFGWSHTRVSWIPCALMLAVGVTGPITGWLLDRFEARIVMGAGAALVVVGFIAASRATTFTELVIANMTLGAGLGASGWLPASLVIANWFGERRGTALGLGLAGMESGGMAMTFTAGYIIARYSWRAAYLTLAVPVLLVALPLYVIVVRTRPRDVLKQTVAESARALPGYEVGKAIRTRVFWMLIVVQLAWGLSASGVFIHIVAYLMGIGYTLRFATTVAGGVLGLAALGKPTMGALADRIGGKNALGISLLLIAVSIISLLGARHGGLIVLFMLFMGLSLASPAALVPMVLAETLGLKRFGTLYGWIQVSVMAGAFTAPLIIGRLYDWTHNYTVGFELCALIALVGAVASFLCVAPQPVNLEVIAHAQPHGSTV